MRLYQSRRSKFEPGKAGDEARPYVSTGEAEAGSKFEMPAMVETIFGSRRVYILLAI